MLETIISSHSDLTAIISHIPTLFLFSTIILYNIIFGYIVITDQLFSSEQSDQLETISNSVT